MKNHFVSLPDLPPEEQERLSELKDRLKYKIIDINVSIGDTVTFNQLLVSFGVYYMKTAEEVRVWSSEIKSAHNGTVKRVSVSKSSRVRPGQSLMVLSYCPHEMEFNGLCAFCGADLFEEGAVHKTKSSASPTKSSIASVSSSKHVLFGSQRGGQRKVVSLRGAALERLCRSNTEHLLSRRKLALVLDIDHTFLHATREAQAKLVAKDPLFSPQTHSFLLAGHRMPYFIKIRPGFRQFLLDVAGAFDIHLYTMSMRKYAEEIVKWIEAGDDTLNQRVSNKALYRSLIQNLVTRDDVPSSKKLLHRLFPCDDGMALIIDDRIDVWPDSMENVLQIHKYLFWPNSDGEAPSQRQLGATEIVFGRKLKEKRRGEVEPALKSFICSFFAELGSVAVTVERARCLVLTQRSPDDQKLKKFGVAIRLELDRLAAAHRAGNGQSEPPLSVLSRCKIRYRINREELRRREGDRVLPCLSAVLLRLHREYYSQHDAAKKAEAAGRAEAESAGHRPDVRGILKATKLAVFHGLTFVFSGLWALDVPAQSTLYWRRAVEFGAKCSETLSVANSEGVTHCVAATMGSAKTTTARTLGLELVHPNWLHNSTTHYMRSDPAIYRPAGYALPDGADTATATATNNTSTTNGNDVDVDDGGGGDDHGHRPAAPRSTASMAPTSAVPSILKKRKRSDDDSDSGSGSGDGGGGGGDGVRRKKRKTVRFEGDGAGSALASGVDPEAEIMDSLTDFVAHFNKNKDLKFGGAMERDIVMAADSERRTESEDDDDGHGDGGGGGGQRVEGAGGDEDDGGEPFDFELIGQDIDGAANQRAEQRTDEVADPKDTGIERERAPSTLSGDGDGGAQCDVNELLQLLEDPEDENEEHDLEHLLNDELETLCS